MNKIIFLDTYAIIEIIEGNKNYEKYLGYNIAITKLNLFELYYAIIRKHGEEVATKEFNKYSDYALDFNNQIIMDAAKLKLIFKKQKISMTDCIGYIKARKLGIRFLTGDKQFEYLPDVEFVK